MPKSLDGHKPIPRGRNGGRKPFAEKPKPVTVTLDQSTIDILKAISPNLSEAIRTLARQSND